MYNLRFENLVMFNKRLHKSCYPPLSEIKNSHFYFYHRYSAEFKCYNRSFGFLLAADRKRNFDLFKRFHYPVQTKHV